MSREPPEVPPGGNFRVRHGACARGPVRERAFACGCEQLAHWGIAGRPGHSQNQPEPASGCDCTRLDRKMGANRYVPPPVGGMAAGRASPLAQGGLGRPAPVITRTRS